MLNTVKLFRSSACCVSFRVALQQVLKGQLLSRGIDLSTKASRLEATGSYFWNPSTFTVQIYWEITNDTQRLILLRAQDVVHLPNSFVMF